MIIKPGKKSFWMPGTSFLGGGVIAPTALPLPGNLVSRFSADAITPQTDNTTLTAWTDSINGIVAGTTIGTGPKYRTNRIGTKPSVMFTGGGLSIATPGALKTAIDSQAYTVFIVFKTTSSATFGALFAAAAGSNAPLYIADGTSVQRYNTFSAPYAGQTAFSTFGSSSTSSNTNIHGSGTGYEAFYINGGCVQGQTQPAPGTGGLTLCIGNNDGNNFPVNAEIFEIVVWNTPLTPPQYMQAQMWACDKYAQAYPWAALTKMPVFFGDSLTSGFGASTVAHTAPYLAAQTLGLSYGQWHNLGVGGISLNNLGVLAPTWVDPIPALIGKKTGLISFEWFNQEDSTTTAGASFLAARKAVANQQTVWGTSTACSLDPSTARNSYNSAWDAAHTLNIDSYMALHADTNIGSNGAFAAHPANFSDSVHLTDTGYPFLASLLVAGFNALP